MPLEEHVSNLSSRALIHLQKTSQKYRRHLHQLESVHVLTIREPLTEHTKCKQMLQNTDK